MRGPALRQATNPSTDSSAGLGALHVLLIDDSSHHTEALLNALRKAGHGIRPAFAINAQEFNEQLLERNWDLLLANEEVGDLDVIRMLSLLRRAGQDAPLVVVVDEVTDALIQTCMRAGASDVVARRDTQRLPLVVARELTHLRTGRTVRDAIKQAQDAELRCLGLLESCRDAIAYVHDGMHVYANPSYLKMFGFDTVQALEEVPLLDIVAPEFSATLKKMLRDTMGATIGETAAEVCCKRKDGTLVRVNVSLSKARYDGESCVQVMVGDLSEREHFEQQLLHMSKRDPETGLFNRTHLREQLAILSKEVEHAGVTSALLLVEIENFDTIRKTVGISLSDIIVQDLAFVIRAQIREGDMLARIGDRSFAVLLTHRLVGASDQLAKAIRIAVADHIWSFDNHSVATTCSVGIAPINTYSHAPDEVVSRADKAVHTALARGGNRIEVVGQESESHVAQEHDRGLQADTVLSALTNQRATLLYQPIVNLHGRTQDIYEVRVALYDEKGSAYSTAQAVERVEQSGEASKLDLWVLDQVLRQLRQQRERGRQVRFFVKLSQQSVRDEGTLLAISRAIRDSGLSAEALTFEIDYQVASHQIKKARAVVNVLRELGCRTALSRFGGGLNSFNVLNHVDVDYLKIDPQAISNLTDNPQRANALRQLHDKARALGKETIATTVQDANTLAFLWQCGIRYAQGHYIQEPSRELSYEFTHA
jgi:multidomain signaling protein FimX